MTERFLHLGHDAPIPGIGQVHSQRPIVAGGFTRDEDLDRHVVRTAKLPLTGIPQEAFLFHRRANGVRVLPPHQDVHVDRVSLVAVQTDGHATHDGMRQPALAQRHVTPAGGLPNPPRPNIK